MNVIWAWWSFYSHIKSEHDKYPSILFNFFVVLFSTYVFLNNNYSSVFNWIGTSTGTTNMRLIHFTSDTWQKVVWKVRRSSHYLTRKPLLSLYLNVTHINYMINLWVCPTPNQKHSACTILLGYFCSHQALQHIYQIIHMMINLK